MLIGVTSDDLLKKKKYSNVLQTFQNRANFVSTFLRRLRGSELQIDIFELSDPVGQAATDINLDAVILT